ncbi:hypothetical protein [Alkaliphilus crotonatoxidans]
MKKKNYSIKVKTCRRCKKIIHENSLQDFCSSCLKHVEEIFDQIREYLREYPGATAFEIEQRLGIPIHVVNNFVKDGRLIEVPNEFLNVECQRCGCLLLSSHHKYCPKCEYEMLKDLEKAKSDMGDVEIKVKGKMRFRTYRE